VGDCDGEGGDGEDGEGQAEMFGGVCVVGSRVHMCLKIGWGRREGCEGVKTIGVTEKFNVGCKESLRNGWPDCTEHFFVHD